MTDSICSRVYAAYTAALGVDLPKLLDRPDKGAAWFAVVNARARIVAEPTDVSEPSAFELSKPIEPQRVCDVYPTKPGEAPCTDLIKEPIPTSLAIRPLVAGDLCQSATVSNARYWHMALANVHEIEPDMLEWRVDPADAAAADHFVTNASGADARTLMRDAYIAAGGEDRDDRGAWIAAALALLTVDKGEYYIVSCRTPGLGDLKVGPVRPGHDIILDEVTARSTEWGGQLAALAKATDTQVERLHAARIEDAMRLWACYELLKKKQEEATRLLIVARLSTTSMPPGPEQTSKG